MDDDLDVRDPYASAAPQVARLPRDCMSVLVRTDAVPMVELEAIQIFERITQRYALR